MWPIFSITLLLTASTLVAPTQAQQCSENSLRGVVDRLRQCHADVETMLDEVSRQVMEICKDIVDRINIDRDRTMAQIQNNYRQKCIADETLGTVVVQASQMAFQFGDRKRTKAFEGVVEVRDATMKALAQIDKLCGPCDRPTRVVLENTGYRVLRHLGMAIEWLRDYTETNIAVFIKGFVEIGKIAGRLNDQVRTTDAACKERLQKELNDEVTSGVEKIVAIFTVNDDKLYSAMKEFLAYFEHAEQPEQAVRDFVNDSQRGIVRTKL